MSHYQSETSENAQEFKCYKLGSISNYQSNLQTVFSTAQKYLDTILDLAASISSEQNILYLSLFLNDWDMAKKLAIPAGWDGEYLYPPQVFWIPSNDLTFKYGFVFQDIKGDSFVISPFDLHWLEEKL